MYVYIYIYIFWHGPRLRARCFLTRSPMGGPSGDRGRGTIPVPNGVSLVFFIVIVVIIVIIIIHILLLLLLVVVVVVVAVVAVVVGPVSAAKARHAASLLTRRGLWRAQRACQSHVHLSTLIITMLFSVEPPNNHNVFMLYIYIYLYVYVYIYIYIYTNSLYNLHTH